MVVYSETKGQFNKDVINNLISDKILTKLREKGINGGSDAEFNSWQNSLKFMSNVLTDGDISGDISFAIEYQIYQIPRTSKRVDFIIAGSDNNEKDNVVIVELKQWEKAEKVADEMLPSVYEIYDEYGIYLQTVERISGKPGSRWINWAPYIRLLADKPAAIYNFSFLDLFKRYAKYNK